MTSTHTARIDLYADVTDRIIAELEKGVDAWEKMWSTSPDTWRPTNARTGKAYRGVNVLFYAMALHARSYRRNRWVTFQQALALGDNVRKGAKGLRLVYWTELAREKEEPEKGSPKVATSYTPPTLVCRHFTAFNVADCDGVDLSDVPGALENNTGVTTPHTRATLETWASQTCAYPYLHPLREGGEEGCSARRDRGMLGGGSPPMPRAMARSSGAGCRWWRHKPGAPNPTRTCGSQKPHVSGTRVGSAAAPRDSRDAVFIVR